MSDEIKILEREDDAALSRRTFGALAAATGLAGAAAAGAAQAATGVTESTVTIKTADGMCEASLSRPQGKGRWPCVVMWPDAFGLRPVFREMGKRLAGEGYVVLVPNQYYRSQPAQPEGVSINFGNPDDMKKFGALRAPLTPDAVARDGATFIGYLDKQPFTKTAAKAGVVGYCMGGPMTLQTAAAVPSRVGAGCSCHGGGLVTDTPDSPHLLVPHIKARFYFAIAANDDQRQPDAKDKLRQAFDAAHLPAKIEVYDGCQHGWCVPGQPVYNQAGAERAWAEMLALYKTALV